MIRSGTIAICLIWGGLALGGSVAVADVEQKLDGSTQIDWSAGLVSVIGAAAGDIRAPTPEVARSSADRKARSAARQKLAAAARRVPVARGKTLGKRLAGDEEAAARLERALDRLLELDVSYGTDGSTLVTMAVPLESLRWVLVGDEHPPTEAGGPTALIVDAAAVLTTPAVGMAVGAGNGDGEPYLGPSLFYRSESAAKADPRLGGRIVRAKATGVKDGVIAVDDGGAVARARKSGAVVVFLLGSVK